MAKDFEKNFKGNCAVLKSIENDFVKKSVGVI